ncbi:MAG TPA: endonuclease Q family protein [Nitrososphaerales archaeon]|nr:endonuclease Q family protein [Nitrososphaerales archaeon]
MRITADLHIHSRYALATSRDTDLEHLAEGARTKGLNLLGTGDITHPLWLKELKSKLKPGDGEGIFAYRGMNWILTGEVSVVYEQAGKIRKVHHLVNVPDLETAEQISEALSKYGNMSSDGRPILKGLGSAEMVEILTGLSSSVVIIPAHAWTPWFSVFGSKSGFDSLEDCFLDQTGKIFAIETGLSSDPPMNWRLSSLDRIALVSNSDAHSPNPWRLGREANVFDLEALTYRELFDAIRSKDPRRFLYTIEVDPSYGKYHFTGHRKCDVSMSPRESMARSNLCPKCGKKMTVGVLQRVEQLADRPEGFAPKGAVPYRNLLPLYEIVSFAMGVNRLYANRVLEVQNRLTAAFGNELNVLLGAPEDDLAKVTSAPIASAIIAVRENRIRLRPGYDGVYGSPYPLA